MKLYQINMNLNKFLKLASSSNIDENSVQDSEELPPDSDNMETILKNLSSLNNFKSRIEYAERNLKRVSSGSSRMVFETKDNKILKLAKNEKGLAQNGVESEPSMRTKHVNGALESDPDDKWIIAEKAEKITMEDFEELTGLTFQEFSDAILYGLKDLTSDTGRKKPENFDEISENEFYHDIWSVASEHHLIPGDLVRISSFKRIDDRIVLVDSGLTREIYDEFYDKNKKKSSSKNSSKTE